MVKPTLVIACTTQPGFQYQFHNFMAFDKIKKSQFTAKFKLLEKNYDESRFEPTTLGP